MINKCSTCKIEKPIDEFYKNKRHKNGHQSSCKICSHRNAIVSSKKHKEKRYEYNKSWRKNNPQKIKQHRLKTKLKQQYGISLEERNYLFTAQNGLCKICVENKATDVDHCHQTGRVRGLLCRACNNAIGLLRENKQILQNAITYLEG